LIGAFLLLMAFPVAASSVLDIPNHVGEIAVGELSAENLQATIDALYTANAPGMGTPWNEGDIATSVAQTLTAMETINGAGVFEAQPVDRATSTPTPQENIPSALTGTAINQPTPTPTVRWVYNSPTPTQSSHSSGGDPPQPTSTPVPTSTPTMDEPTSPSPTTEPSATSIPTTPAPTRTPKCNPRKTPPHPRACPASFGEQGTNGDD
jgi:hypothetical protein